MDWLLLEKIAAAIVVMGFISLPIWPLWLWHRDEMRAIRERGERHKREMEGHLAVIQAGYDARTEEFERELERLKNGEDIDPEAHAFSNMVIEGGTQGLLNCMDRKR